MMKVIICHSYCWNLGYKTLLLDGDNLYTYIQSYKETEHMMFYKVLSCTCTNMGLTRVSSRFCVPTTSQWAELACLPSALCPPSLPSSACPSLAGQCSSLSQASAALSGPQSDMTACRRRRRIVYPRCLLKRVRSCFSQEPRRVLTLPWAKMWCMPTSNSITDTENWITIGSQWQA